MGNQLVGIAPSQIYPVEHYLSDHVDLSFDQSLGSTRFFKVARVKSREGMVVVKVFAIQDPSLPLAEHKEKILKIKEQLASAFNCLPFQRVVLTDKACLLMRMYCMCSIYDRMSARPFLSVLEKKWITFQVLCALHSMHKLGVCHGDIKLENIMVTSWLWVLVTDIASFKPTFLPDDNPADFSCFFDTSGRRLCYVAPERFIGATDPTKPISEDKSDLLISELPCKIGELVPSMDIFSAGCALLELWNDGTPALDLPGLLAYRNGSERPPSMTLPDTAEPELKQLLESMTERNPRHRKSAEIYLDEARGKMFPEYFYAFLQSYMLIYSSQPILPPDEKIQRIHQDIKNVIKLFTQPSDAKDYKDLVEDTAEKKVSADNIDMLTKDNFKVLDLNEEDYSEQPEERPVKKEMGADSEGLVLITALVISCIRGLRHCTSKLDALEIIELLCQNSSSEIILDRILPYIIYMTQDSVSRVRVAALNVLTQSLSYVETLPPDNCNVFPEYILPDIAPRATDPCERVRIAYANNIAKLAETAVRFLDQTQCTANKEATNINYETELSTLHEMVRSTVSSLLTDSQASVKRALVENGITKLCVFFGKQKANDVILSHMVTFLNDKESTALRGCFFDCVVGVCAYVGHHCAPILTPLVQQGLTDQSEWIIAKALRATANLAELGLLQKQTLCTLLAESVPYLAHPNMWIRHEVCGLVSCIAGLLNPIDVNCKILPLVWPHLTHKLIQVDRPELLLESLAEPIPRAVLETVLRHRDVDRLVQTLRERRAARLKVKQGMLPEYSEMSQQLKNLFRRLASDGMTEQVENQLLAMSAHLIKIQRSTSQQPSETPGRLNLKNVSLSKSVQLDSGAIDTHMGANVTGLNPAQRRTHKSSLSQETHMNTEWQHMFGQTADSHGGKVAPSTSQSVAGASNITPSMSTTAPLASHLTHSASYVQYSMAPCRSELRNLTSRMQQKHSNSLRTQDPSVMGAENALPPSTWRPGNQLLSYLHEHKSRVNRLVTLPAHLNMFASCSDDGTVRLWDCANMDGHAYINKSRSVYNRGAGPVIALAACEGGQSLVGATQEGSLFVLRVDAASARMTLSQGRQTGGTRCADVACSAVSPALIVYATGHSALVGWDLRAPGNAFKLQGSVRGGAYTCVNSMGTHAVAGSASGALALWDLRFQLPLHTIEHPNGERVRRVLQYSSDGSSVWACGFRDACAWSLESTQRTHALWPFTNGAQPLQYNGPASHYITCGYYGTTNNSSFLITGGTDQRIRFWDLNTAEDSYVLVHAHSDPLKSVQNALRYRSRIVDGTTVLQEVCKQQLPSTPCADENIYKSVENRSFHHIAPITDITMTQGNRCYLVSSSADGVINVWK